MWLELGRAERGLKARVQALSSCCWEAFFKMLSWEVDFSAALAAAMHSPANSSVLAADENTAPSKGISAPLSAQPLQPYPCY